MCVPSGGTGGDAPRRCAAHSLCNPAGLLASRVAWLHGTNEPVREWLESLPKVLLHGFQKKSQKTPKSDLDLGRQRMQAVSAP
jgi:hypothetical protein